MSFGRTLQDLRREIGLSQTELAARSGTAIDSLRNWEQDRALPKIDAATRLARALGVSLDRLAVREEKGTTDTPAKPRGRPPRATPATPPAEELEAIKKSPRQSRKKA
jgi:transcriptional regulator with XRE-family HTH domain